MVYKILTKLTDPEYDLFLDHVGAGTHGRKISSLIRKTNGDISRDEIFKRVFKQKRQIKNDHLLRNELSILKKKLELFIVQNTIADIPGFVAYYKSYVLAQWCIKRTLIEEAEKYIHEALTIAKEKNGWHGLLKINRIRFQATQYSKSSYYSKLALLHSLEKDHIYYLKEYIAEEVRYTDFIRAGANKLSANLRTTKLNFDSTTDFNVGITQSKNRIAEFYHLKSLAYSHSGLKAVQFLKGALECLSEDLEIFLKEEEKMACMSAMAMEYSVAGEYPKAAEVFEKVLSHPEFEHFGSRHALLFNYCTTLLKIKEYKKAILHLDELDQMDVEPIVKERIYTMKCNCYIFLEDLDEIKRILPANLQSFELSVRMYYRILYLIYYIIKEDFEMASRELSNIKQVKDLEETPNVGLVKLFERFLTAKEAFIYTEKGRQKKLDLLKKELQTFQSATIEGDQTLPATWLIGRSEQFILQHS